MALSNFLNINTFYAVKGLECCCMGLLKITLKNADRQRKQNSRNVRYFIQGQAEGKNTGIPFTSPG